MSSSMTPSGLPGQAPLAGVRVLDLGRHLAGPTAGMWLADLGADVIKIENPGAGESGRTAGPPFVGQESVFFLAANRSKKSLALDLKRPAGQAVFRRLASKADVVLENFRPGVMEAFNIGYDTLRDLQPGLIYCSITGFGWRGPWASRPAVDQVIQAFSGLMSITGFPGGEPVRSGVPISDLLAGSFAAFGIVTALHARQSSGRGQRIDTSLLESMVAMLNFQGVRYLNNAGEPPPAGNHHPIIAPYGVFRAHDGYLVIGAAHEKGWRRLCEVIGAPELAEDKGERFTRRLELAEEISQRLARDAVQVWCAKLSEAGIPCSPIQTVGEALEHPQVQELGMAVQVDHPEVGQVGLLRFPIEFSESSVAHPVAPPVLGQDTREVLIEVGLTEKEIRRLAEEEIIQLAPEDGT